MKIYRYFSGKVPWYLAKHYWWAYLWPKSVWFFDHQFIVNAILFFQYHKLMHATLDVFSKQTQEEVLQLTCVYGSLTPRLSLAMKKGRLHLTDVAGIQLQQVSKKCSNSALILTKMNAEKLGYKDNAFKTIILFFLLHEMPPESRMHTLAECVRILNHKGRLIITEYAPLPKQHILYRIPFCRWVLTTLEPFLASFWHEDVEKQLQTYAACDYKQVMCVSQKSIFHDFYRVSTYVITLHEVTSVHDS